MSAYGVVASASDVVWKAPLVGTTVLHLGWERNVLASSTEFFIDTAERKICIRPS